MADYSAGGSSKLGIIRYGRELMEQFERIGTGSDIYPGEAVEKTTDANGDEAFQPHSGNVPENELYVAIEARGRGMDAQTDTGYVADEDSVFAIRAAGGGLNLMVAAGETVTDGDALVADPGGTGEFVVYASGSHSVDDIVAYADEDADLSGNTDPELVAADME